MDRFLCQDRSKHFLDFFSFMCFVFWYILLNFYAYSSSENMFTAGHRSTTRFFTTTSPALSFWYAVTPQELFNLIEHRFMNYYYFHL